MNCYICHIAISEDKTELPYLKFNWLDGNPCICERCLAKKLGIDVPWSKEAITLVFDKRKKLIEPYAKRRENGKFD